jgi:hypothetical protein
MEKKTLYINVRAYDNGRAKRTEFIFTSIQKPL